MMGERIVTSVFLLTAIAITVRNGATVSRLVMALSEGTQGLVRSLVVLSSPNTTGAQTR